MDRINQPFFRKARNAWYLQVGKSQVKLAEDKAEAFRKWHEIMSEGLPANESSKAPITVPELIKLFLEDLSQTKSQNTWQWYDLFLTHLALGVEGVMAAELVRVSDINRIIASHKDWKLNTKHNFARACKRLFRWAEIEGHIQKDPIQHLVKPPTEARTDYITAEQMAKIEELVPQSAFKMLLQLAWDTGMRPQELTRIESRHYNKEFRCIVFPREEAKGKRQPRTIYLGTDRAVQIVEQLCEENPSGPIFINTKGSPYCKNSLICALKRMATKTGIKTHLGAFRKGYCTEALQNGVDPITLSKLMGHTDLTMVNRVYAQIQQNKEFMLSAAQKAKGL